MRQSTLGFLAVGLGVAVLLVGFAGYGCTQAGCPGDGGVEWDSFSYSSGHIHWTDACNSCGTDAAPVFAGLSLVASGAVVVGTNLVGELDTS
ncbi:hypothetical protein [Haloarchaeobius sp. DFWS5]|uniref:hypothetical protein n=1 Tax=Haloarchaeobius sp. DFWS5 TaxID=3446114 RepID=UPI003EBDC5CC